MKKAVTLDPDVVKLLRHATHGSQQNFKEALNDGLRRGLAHFAPAVTATPFVVKARPMGLRAGLDLSRLHGLADDLEAEAFASTTKPAPSRITLSAPKISADKLSHLPSPGSNLRPLRILRETPV